MDSNPPRAPEVYERFLGFPKDQDEATRFYKHCKEYIAFPDFPEKGPKKFRLLSVGTGYGRADFPLIRAYIEHYERPHGSHALSFQVDCVDPSKGFQKMLLNALGQDRYQIFSSELSIEDGANNTFQVRGKSRSGKSCIVINGYRRGLSEFLRDDDEGGTLPPFHCIVGILSFQYIKSLKTTFPLLLDKLCESGLIVIGETCSEGAWLSKPPPSIVGPTAKVNRKWFDLWTDWHKVLRRRGINRRLRLFPPHNFWLLRDTLERSGYRSIILPKNSEFTWKKTVGSEVLGEVKALIRNGCWRGYVSSLYLADEELGDNGNRGGEVLNELMSADDWLSGEWKDKNTDIDYQNGLRLYVYKNENDRLANYDSYEHILQKVILESSVRTIREQGISDYMGARETHKEERQSTLLMQLIQSLDQHIEIDNGCFIIGLSVSSRQASKSAMGGSLIPCSEISIRNGRASEFFEGLPLRNTDEKTYSRIWIWLYTLYLGVTKRPSAVAEKLWRTFLLEPAFNCIVLMDKQIERLEPSEQQIWFQLKADRVQLLRKKTWRILKENAPNRIKDIIEWNEKSQTVRALEHLWGTGSPLVNIVKHGRDFDSEFSCDREERDKTPERSYTLPKLFCPAQPLRFNKDQLDALFGKQTIEKFNGMKNKLFKKWADDRQEPGIHSMLQEIHLKQKFSEDPLQLWLDVFAQFYLFGLFLHERGVNYILHTPAMEFNLAGIWGAFQLFMDEREFLSFRDQTNPIYLSDTFYKFILPFDIIQQRDLVSPQVEERGRELRASAAGHEIKHVTGALQRDWVQEIGRLFEIERVAEDNPAPCKIGQIRVWNEELAQNLAIVPFREFINTFSGMLILWTGQANPDDLPFEIAPPSIPDCVKTCWKFAKKVIALFILHKKSIWNCQDIKNITAEYDTILSVYPEAPKINVINEITKRLILPWSGEGPTYSMNFVRLLMASFTNILKHCDPSKEITITLSESSGTNKLLISIQNHCRKDPVEVIAERLRGLHRISLPACENSTLHLILEKIKASTEGFKNGDLSLHTKDILILLLRDLGGRLDYHDHDRHDSSIFTQQYILDFPPED